MSRRRRFGQRGQAITEFALVGPLFMRAVVWGQSLAPDAAEKTADVILAAFTSNRRGS